MGSRKCITLVAGILALSLVSILAASCGSPTGPSSASSVVYATAQEGSVLVAIDPTTGAASIVGPLNASGAFALAARGDGVFFTVTDSGFVANPDARLATVDPRTGGATVYGEPFGVYLRMMGLAFASDGTLYGSSPITQSLYRLDVSTGRPERVGPFGVNGVMDLAFDRGGTLYANTTGAIYRVDRVTGAATLVTPVRGAQMLMGITFDASGTLYATNFMSESELYRIDLATGTASLVGRTGQSFVHSAEFDRRR
jgi:outer membrane protein assembly factor BamB